MLVTVVLYKVGLVIAGEFGPLIRVHNPVPGLGLFPARVVEVKLQNVCAVPAFETGVGYTVTTTVNVDPTQLPAVGVIV
jgi:hypothetical protein